MNSRVTFVACLVAVATSMSVAAEPGAALTLDEALLLAERQSPLIAAAEAEARAGQGRLQQASLRPNPSLALTETNLFNEDLVGFDGQTGTYEVEQPIELGGKRGARRQVAQAGVDLAGWDLASTRLAVRASAMQAFHATLVAGERVLLATEALELAQRVESVARARVEAGRVAPIEASRASVSVASARIERERVQRALEVQRIRLAATWGGMPAVESVAGRLADVEPLPPIASLEALLGAAPDLARWPAEAGARDAAVRLARAEGTPDIDIVGGWTNYHDAGESAWTLGMRIGLPFANRNQGAVAEAVALREKADADRLVMEVDLRSRLIAARGEASLAIDTARAIEAEVVSAARLAFDLATAGFEAGKLSYLDVLDSQRTLIDARRQHLEALAAHHFARAELTRLLGDGMGPIARDAAKPQEAAP